MKFDYIIGNPPYHIVTGDTTKPIWDKIIIKSFLLLEEKGTITMVHPGGWRFANNKSKGAVQEVQDIYKTNNVLSLELNDIEAGYRTFGARTDYDVVTMIKEPNKSITNVKTVSDNLNNVNLQDFSLIPTDKIELFLKLKASKNEETVTLINDYNYGTDDRFPHTSETKDSNFKYPVIYAMPEKGIKYMYSSCNDLGHYGISKLIISKAGFYSKLDLDGEYAMTQFSYGLVDTPENLIKIQKVLETPEFRSLKGFFCGIGPSVNKNAITDANGTMFKFIKEFKKDFWKEFI